MACTVTVKRATRTEVYADVKWVVVRDGALQLKFEDGHLLWINHRDWVDCTTEEF